MQSLDGGAKAYLYVQESAPTVPVSEHQERAGESAEAAAVSEVPEEPEHVGESAETAAVAEVAEEQEHAGESAEAAAVAEQEEHAGQAIAREVADLKFVEEQRSGLEYQLNEAKVYAKELREQMEQIGSAELRDRSDFVVTMTEQTCDFLLRRAEALLDEEGEAQLRDAHGMLVAAETAIQTAQAFIEFFNEVMADNGDKASAPGGRLRRLLQNLKGGKLHLWNLIANVLTPRELTVKGGVEINHLVNAGIEIRFGEQ
jgi:hypothetical protein